MWYFFGADNLKTNADYFAVFCNSLVRRCPWIIASDGIWDSKAERAFFASPSVMPARLSQAYAST